MGPFAKFSYTLIGNKKRYGSSEPPRYNLGDVKLPIFMVYSNRSDNILVKEVRRLMRAFNDCQLGVKIDFTRFIFNRCCIFYLVYEYFIPPCLEGFQAFHVTYEEFILFI